MLCSCLRGPWNFEGSLVPSTSGSNSLGILSAWRVTSSTARPWRWRHYNPSKSVRPITQRFNVAFQTLEASSTKLRESQISQSHKTQSCWAKQHRSEFREYEFGARSTGRKTCASPILSTLKSTHVPVPFNPPWNPHMCQCHFIHNEIHICANAILLTTKSTRTALVLISASYSTTTLSLFRPNRN